MTTSKSSLFRAILLGELNFSSIPVETINILNYYSLYSIAVSEYTIGNYSTLQEY